MPIYILVMLFVATLVAPAIAALLVWARQPQTLESLAVRMTLAVTAAALVHLGYAAWLLLPQPIDHKAWVMIVLGYAILMVATGGFVDWLCHHAMARLSEESTATVTPLRKAS